MDRAAPHDDLRCDEASLALAAQIAGELAPDAERALDLHVARCARCARERDELATLQRALERDAGSGPAPSEVAEARMQLRRALERERAAPRARAGAPTIAPRVLRRELLKASGFALLIALFVPLLPRLQQGLAPARGDNVALSLAGEARDLAHQVGAWLPTLPDWSLPTEPPESLRSWLGALHSDAR